MRSARQLLLMVLFAGLLCGNAMAATPAAPASGMAATTEAVLFYLFAGFAVISAVAIVFSSNIIRAALWLLGTLVAVAALYLLMAAYFLGAIQLIVYAGGTLVLIVFGVMLTARSPWVTFAPRKWEIVIGALVCAALLAGLSLTLLRTDWAARATPAAESATVAQFGSELLTTYLVPFEIASVLLLAVMIGAVYLARPEKR